MAGTMFTDHQHLLAFDGKGYEVLNFLGDGGQGEVYEVATLKSGFVNSREYLKNFPESTSSGSKDLKLALKWYFPQHATTQQKRMIAKLVEMGPPSNRFLWPLALIETQEGFGYVMPVRPSNYEKATGIMTRKIEPSFRSVVRACYLLADGFLEVHAKGLAYCDISFGNIFVDPLTGDILICDNDNVTIDGEYFGGVFGTQGFMAPEIVRLDKGVIPTAETDLYSLSTLIFYLMMVHHPLEGAKYMNIHCFDAAAQRLLYGDEPVFIFDPNDNSNYPVSPEQNNALLYWDVYPQSTKDLFIQAFTIGRDAGNRVRLSQWRTELSSLGDKVLYCGVCGCENFYDPNKIRKRNPLQCWNCSNVINIPPRLKVGPSVVMLNHDSAIYPHHIDPLNNLYNFDSPVGIVEKHKDKNIWVITNKSNSAWTVERLNGSIKKVEPEKYLPISNGLKINFGQAKGEIKA